MAIFPTIGGKRTLHPGEALQWAQEHRTPVDFWQRANSYSCKTGPEPGVAWLLMRRSELDQLDPAAFHELKWVDGKRTLRIPSLLIVKSYTVNLALAGDKNAARLVEFRDRRHLFRMSSINKQYNVRIPAPSTTSGTGLYYPESLLGGALWEWQDILDDLFDQLPDPGAEQTGIGNPVLSFTPDEPPEGFRFIGENAWDAMHAVLEKIHGTTAYDPVLDLVGPYIDTTAIQTGLTNALNGLSNRLMYDYDADDPARDYTLAKFPETVRVFFNRRELYHGTEKDTIQTGNWEMTPVVSKDFSTGITGVHSGSVLRVWDDLLAEFDSDGVNFNSGDLQLRADAVGGNIKNTLTFERMRRMYSGLVFETPFTNVISPILPGSEMSEIRWRDYGDETGLVTEVLHLSKHDEVFSGLDGASVNEHLRPPDLARATHPLWPRLSQPVRVDDGSSSTGATLNPNSDLLFPGFVRRWANGGWVDLDACWIRPVDLKGTDESAVGDLRQLDALIGRLSGVETSEGSTRPVYLVREGSGSSGKGLPIRAIIGSSLAPIEVEGTALWYIDRNGVPDTDWALMDGVSNAILLGGSGLAMWERTGDQDTFFVRARRTATDADDTASGRTVPLVGDPSQDIIQLNDHNDHTHEILDLCEIKYTASAEEPTLCAWEPPNGACGTECVSTVRGASGCAETLVPGVLEHTFVFGQGTDPNVPDDFNVAPPNKQWHWFERVAETSSDVVAVPSSAPFVAPLQPTPSFPSQPIAAGAVYQDDGSP